MKIKHIAAVAALTLVLCSNAHAGFLTGFVVGSVAGSNGQDQNTIVASDTHDVIMCCIASSYSGDNYMNMCTSTRSTEKTMTPAQFAGQAGYKTLFKIGHVITAHGCDKIIMEVGK